MKSFFKYWFPILIWAGFIFYLSSIPDLKSELEQDFILRKIAHILEYAILSFLLLRAIGIQSDIKKTALLSIIISILYAVSDEYHQSFVLGRKGSLKDIGIDSIGILITTGIWYIKSKKQ